MGVFIVEGEGAVLGKFGASHCNQMGNLLPSCAKVRESIELSFGVVSGVSHGMGVLKGVHVPQVEGEGGSEILFPIALGRE